jgi:A/G-specific adenine glycosylase
MTLAAGEGRRKQRSQARAQARALLAWYDRHRRVLPWRAPPGAAADPYRVWLSEIMLQQTTVKAAAPYFVRFTARWPDVAALAAAPLEEVLRQWAGLGYYARARNLHACARAVVAHHGGRLPAAPDALRALPGIGPYTAAAIAAIAFGERTAAVDGNVERVVARLLAVEAPLPGARPTIRALAQHLVPPARCGDFAQALMDLGATICTPKKPACARCPWSSACAARRGGDPESFPRRAQRRSGRLRRGAAFVVTRADGCVLVRSRPLGGLLGGMTEVPTSEWVVDLDAATARAAAPRLAQPLRWRRLPGCVSHVFTHFPLELVVLTACVPAGTPAPRDARWAAELSEEALPTLMRKVLAHAAAASPGSPHPLSTAGASGLMPPSARSRRAT